MFVEYKLVVDRQVEHKLGQPKIIDSVDYGSQQLKLDTNEYFKYLWYVVEYLKAFSKFFNVEQEFNNFA